MMFEPSRAMIFFNPIRDLLASRLFLILFGWERIVHGLNGPHERGR